MEGRPWTTMSRTGCSQQGQSGGECQKVKSDIYNQFKRFAFYFDNQLLLE